MSHPQVQTQRFCQHFTISVNNRHVRRGNNNSKMFKPLFTFIKRFLFHVIIRSRRIPVGLMIRAEGKIIHNTRIKFLALKNYL
jgi:hypothetical protein